RWLRNEDALVTNRRGQDGVLSLAGSRLSFRLLRPFWPRTWSQVWNQNGTLAAQTQEVAKGRTLMPGKRTAVIDITGNPRSVVRLGGPVIGWTPRDQLVYVAGSRIFRIHSRGRGNSELIDLSRVAREAGAAQAVLVNPQQAIWSAAPSASSSRPTRSLCSR